MEISQEELKGHILDYLENNRLMALATSKDDIPWAATVFFAYDPDLNFYFISVPDSRKTRNLGTNPRVSGAINEFQKTPGKILGLQLEGVAEMLDKNSNKKELELFKNRFNWADEYLHDHELYKI